MNYTRYLESIVAIMGELGGAIETANRYFYQGDVHLETVYERFDDARRRLEQFTTELESLSIESNRHNLDPQFVKQLESLVTSREAISKA